MLTSRLDEKYSIIQILKKINRCCDVRAHLENL